jgi:predicted phage gp36 major capsid-like protein
MTTRARAPLTPMTVSLVDPLTEQPIRRAPYRHRRRAQVQPLEGSAEVLLRALERRQRDELRKLRDSVRADLADLAAAGQLPAGLKPSRRVVITNRANLTAARAADAKRRRPTAAKRRRRLQPVVATGKPVASPDPMRPWPRIQSSDPNIVSGPLW